MQPIKTDPSLFKPSIFTATIVKECSKLCSDCTKRRCLIRGNKNILLTNCHFKHRVKKVYKRMRRDPKKGATRNAKELLHRTARLPVSSNLLLAKIQALHAPNFHH